MTLKKLIEKLKEIAEKVNADEVNVVMADYKEVDNPVLAEDEKVVFITDVIPF